MHNFSNTLRNSLLGSANDLVIESESTQAPKISFTAGGQQNFDSSITQSYTFQNTSFY